MEWIKLILRSIIILVLQVTIFDRLQIQGWGYPMMYLVLLLNIPTQIPRWAEMLIGMLVGIIIDICNNSMGVHMAACIALSFIRPILLKNAVQDIERIKGEINSQTIGFAEYIKCTIILTLCHHFMIFMLEAWSLQNWWMIIIQTLFSSILTIILILGYDLLKNR
jgi:rod shape-determining protein MreD